MKVYHYTGDRDASAPEPEGLHQKADDDEVRELLEEILAWKGSVTPDYMERFYDVGRVELQEIAEELQSEGEVEIREHPDDAVI